MKISVVIPLYNKKDTILRALNSVISQTFLPEEIIVVNDGSTDGSKQIVEELKHPMINLLNQSNQGVSSARNRGIAYAKHDWIALLDADDEWLPEYLETITLLSHKYPDCSVFATAYSIQNGEGIKEEIILNRLKFNNDFGLLENYFEVASHSDPPLCSSAVVARKSALKDIGCFPAGITSGEDLLTWARLATRYEIAYCKCPLSIFIKDDTAYNRIPEEPDCVSFELIKLTQQCNIPYLKQYISFWHKMRAKSFLSLDYKVRALNEIFKSIRYYPLSKAWFYLPFVLINSTVFINASQSYKRLIR